MKGIHSLLSTLILFLSLGSLQAEGLFAKDPEIKPEDVVANHLKSIGKNEVLAAVKSRVVTGSASVEFIQGGGIEPRILNGQFQIVSEPRRLGFGLKFDNRIYHGEYLAFDGQDATFSNSSILFLEGFVRQYYGLLEEGLMAGTLSAAWPLLDVKERQPKLKYSKRKVEGQQLHEITYSPKSRGGTLQLRIKLFFNLETFRHVMTEYKYYYSGIELLFREQFEDFREVDGMTLPHKYTIYYSSDRYDSNLSFPGEPHPTAGLGSPSIVRWTFKAKQWLHNAQIDPKLFKAY